MSTVFFISQRKRTFAHFKQSDRRFEIALESLCFVFQHAKYRGEKLFLKFTISDIILFFIMIVHFNLYILFAQYSQQGRLKIQSKYKLQEK